MKRMTSQQIRLAAASLIEREGWCQGTPRLRRTDGGYRYCLIGACREVAGYYAATDAYAEAEAEAAYYAAAEAARAASGACANVTVAQAAFYAIDGVGAWNDSPGRTVGEVLAALRGEART